MIPKIYLAGKINKKCWRHRLVRGLREADWQDSPLYCKEDFLPNFHYVGPFFTSCDHGCFHGNSSHGMFGGKINLCNEEAYTSKKLIFLRCLQGIESADFIFAYISTKDAFGTQAELGAALHLGKYVVICYAPDVTSPTKDDYWFINCVANEVYFNVFEEQISEYFKTALKNFNFMAVV